MGAHTTSDAPTRYRSNDEVALWATRDAKGMADCFAEDGVYDNVPEGKPMVGRAASSITGARARTAW